MEERERTKELCRVGEKIFARHFRESIVTREVYERRRVGKGGKNA